uniref:Cytosine-specific methyltransferase n=1 Tax=Candidatus Kentrum sp. SD TaxID=2126332 RepID=A0A450Y6U5_9GAMM|nr:MAG: DNA (cytosine-5)-methyltransferase 1 [Candidatus Kentron sp. SD]VFK42270.1 MAG: DNA (cytosine-5)-methyltransferase 1 [Candidatus Kentron sp. SD]
MTQRTYKAISLFSGAMGLDLGIRNTGRFRFLACVEKEPIFCCTIRKNIANGNLSEAPKVYECDIKQLSPRQLLADFGLESGELDLLVGGPPCQSFSTAGKRATVQDPRGTLLWDFLRFVEVLRPKVFLMENVRGLMSAALRHRPIAQRPGKGGPPLAPDEKPGSVVHLFAEDLSGIGGTAYHMDCFEVNAVNYGAPQLRERALFIGNRFNQEIDFPDPTHGRTKERGCQLELFPDVTAVRQPWRTLGEAIRGMQEDDPVTMDFSPRKKSYLSLVPPGGNWRHLPEKLQRESMGKAFFAKGGRSGWWRRLSYGLPCPTLVTMPNHASTALCHPEQVRALTVREYCRIQGFPDEWAVCGSPAQQYAQIGNAVPARLGEVAGDVLADVLDYLATNGWQAREKPPQAYRTVYIESHIRTRQWYRNGKALQWEDGQDNLDVICSLPKTQRALSVIKEG